MSRTRVPVVAVLCAGLATALAAGPIEAAVTVSFQDGVNGYAGTVDTMIRQAAPATAYAADTSVGWDTDDPSGTGLYNYVLIRFDGIIGSGAGQIPAGSAIASATLSYYVFNTGNSGNVNEVVVDWAEDVTYNTFGGDAGVQADEYGAARGSATGGAGTNSVDVTASLAAWVNNPSANRGWIIRPTGTDGVD
ncbi:MAG TPA: DNRLRE domain-containing protein, partial [Phycisphaerae bacterium]|nr:DNRLRE domain-containing protein [Phycisphaerae bacterium]